jgi:hypothetical protein
MPKGKNISGILIFGEEVDILVFSTVSGCTAVNDYVLGVGKPGVGHSTPSESGVVTAGGVFEIIIKNARLTVAKGNFHVRRTPLNRRIPFLNDNSRSPLGVPGVENPIPHLQV